MQTTIKIKEIRRLITDYIYAEGCSCCRDIDAHELAAEKISKALNVAPYSDNSGWDFYKYRTELPEKAREN